MQTYKVKGFNNFQDGPKAKNNNVLATETL